MAEPAGQDLDVDDEFARMHFSLAAPAQSSGQPAAGAADLGRIQLELDAPRAEMRSP